MEHSMKSTLSAEAGQMHVDVTLTVRVTFDTNVHPLFDRNRVSIVEAFSADLMERAARTVHDTQDISLEGWTFPLSIDAVPFADADVDLGIHLELGAGLQDEARENVIWLTKPQ